MKERDYVVTEPTHIAGLKLIAAKAHHDERGANLRLWEEREFIDGSGIVDLTFREESVSMSVAGALRGIHVEPKAWRLMTCLAGRAFVAVVDMRNWAGSYLEHATFELSDERFRQLLVPPMMGIGALAQEDGTILHYKWTVACDPERQFTYRYDHPRFGIAWPLEGEPILSERDREAR